MKILFYIILPAIILFSCRPYREVNINTLQPAQITLPADVNNVLVANRFLPANMDVIEKLNDTNYTPDSISNYQYQTHQFITNVLYNMSLSNRLTNIIPIGIYLDQYDSLTHEQVREICNQNQAEMLFLLNEFYIETIDTIIYIKNHLYNPRSSSPSDSSPTGQLMPQKMREHYNWSKVILDVIIEFRFSLYYAEDSSLNRELVFNKSLMGLSALYGTQQFMKYQDYSREQKHDLYETTISLAGRFFSEYILPYWITEKRVIYQKGNQLLQQSASFIHDNEIDTAIAILLEIEESENQLTAYRAKMNLAYCYEMKDILWKARKYALEAYRIQNTQEAASLFNRLYERIKLKAILREQYGEE